MAAAGRETQETALVAAKIENVAVAQIGFDNRFKQLVPVTVMVVLHALFAFGRIVPPGFVEFRFAHGSSSSRIFPPLCTQLSKHQAI